MFISSTRAFVDVGTFHEDDEADPCDNKHTDLVSLRPAHELEELASLGGGLHPGHQLRQRHNLLVDLEDPRPGHCDYLDYHNLHGNDDKNDDGNDDGDIPRRGLGWLSIID